MYRELSASSSVLKLYVQRRYFWRRRSRMPIRQARVRLVTPSMRSFSALKPWSPGSRHSTVSVVHVASSKYSTSTPSGSSGRGRSEERRVGKECTRWTARDATTNKFEQDEHAGRRAPRTCAGD